MKHSLVSAAVLLCVCGTALAQNGADVCADATLITFPVGVNTVSVTGTTVAATATGAATGMPTCGNSVNSRDVWYVCSIPAYGQFAVDTCTASYDTVVSIHTICPGQPGAATLVCDDNGCGSLRSRATLYDAEGGRTVYVRVGGNGTNNGTFTLRLTLTPHPTPPVTSIGPDVTTGRILDIGNYGTATTFVNGGPPGGINVRAFSVGTESCNRGDAVVQWIDNTNRAGYSPTEHPVIAQNMYRYSVVDGAGRFEQIGQSWLKHGFASTNSTLSYCGACQSPPFGGDQLGVNCTDAYGASLNGGQVYLAPRSEVNPNMGFAPWPHATGVTSTSTLFYGPTSATGIGMRLQVPVSEITSQPAGSTYYVEGHYITKDDAQYVRPGQTVALNGLNNASWHQVNPNWTGIGGASSTQLTGTTRQRDPAIRAWKDVLDPSISLVTADYLEDNVAPFWSGKFIQARFYVGAKVTLLPSGLYRYEYAVFNLNSSRAGASFTVPIPNSANVTNIGFHAPISHSGEPFDNTAWTSTKAQNQMVFSTQSFDQNPNANAIRWSTLYNFRFDADVAPTTGDAVIGLFRPGSVGSASVATASGVPVPNTPAIDPLDFNGDGFVEPGDLDEFITAFFGTDPVENARCDFNDDGFVEPGDLDEYITAYFNN
ncbi:MAG: EF-hand domain-containing protein [Phycisphaerales bacterium]